jgi:hypothetical protein
MIRELILRWARNREPDFIIGGRERPYLRRHWLIPRNPLFNVYVHEFLRSDDDRALHTHPWMVNASWLLAGSYIEHTARPNCDRIVVRVAGDWKVRWGASPHRIELRAPCWTLFMTGPRVREWGFLCPKGFVHWKRFTAPTDKGSIGAGCDA